MWLGELMLYRRLVYVLQEKILAKEGCRGSINFWKCFRTQSVGFLAFGWTVMMYTFLPKATEWCSICDRNHWNDGDLRTQETKKSILEYYFHSIFMSMNVAPRRLSFCREWRCAFMLLIVGFTEKCKKLRIMIVH